MKLSKKQPKFEALRFETKAGELVEVNFDLRKLFTGAVVYINGTKVAKQFGKDVRSFTRSKECRDYVAALEADFDVRNLHIKTTKSGPNRGTWIHKDLVIFFSRWLSADFAVWCDRKIQELITYGHAWIEARNNAKKQFKKVSKLVDIKLKPAMTSKNDIQWAYKKEADLINIAVLGVSAVKFRRDNKIPKGDGLRDHLNKEQNELFDEAEGFDCALIHMGTFDYYERKQRVENFVNEITGYMEAVAL